MLGVSGLSTKKETLVGLKLKKKEIEEFFPQTLDVLVGMQIVPLLSFLVIPSILSRSEISAYLSLF